MFRNMLADAQEALGFLVSQTSHIEPTVYRQRYPSIQYPNLVPIDRSANEWAKSVTFFSVQEVGKADWFGHMAKDMPMADVTRAMHESTVDMAGIGYRYTLQELGQAMMIPGANLGTDRANAARKAAEEMLDRIVIYGDTSKGWTGLINSDSAVTVVTAAAGSGSGTPTEWVGKSATEIIKDVNDALVAVQTSTNEVEMADTVLLPLTELVRLGTEIIPSTTMSVGEYLRSNNAYTFQTGRPLLIRGVRGLETAGEGGVGRMIVYRSEEEVLKLHLPMAHRFLPVWQTGPMVFDVPGIFRTGGLDIRLPGAVRYVDGIIVPEEES